MIKLREVDKKKGGKIISRSRRKLHKMNTLHLGKKGLY